MTSLWCGLRIHLLGTWTSRLTHCLHLSELPLPCHLSSICLRVSCLRGHQRLLLLGSLMSLHLLGADLLDLIGRHILLHGLLTCWRTCLVGSVLVTHSLLMQHELLFRREVAWLADA